MKNTPFRAENRDGMTFDRVRRYLDEFGPNNNNSRTQHFEIRNSRELTSSRDLRRPQKYEAGNLLGQLFNGDPSRNDQERLNKERNKSRQGNEVMGCCV